MKTKPSKTDRILEALGWIMLIGTLMYLIIGWSSFPDKVPMHYGAAGEIDRWGGKGEILFLVVLWWIMYLVISAVERSPQIWNTGVKVTAANQARVYRTLKYMVDSGGRVRVICCSKPCMAPFLLRTVPLVTPEPPYFASSELRISL